MEPGGEAGSGEDRRALQVDNAIRAIKEKKPLPEIDFTIHTMEDGTQVNTMERVCKGWFSRLITPPYQLPTSATLMAKKRDLKSYTATF
jgi:hypothetical protein